MWIDFLEKLDWECMKNEAVMILGLALEKAIPFFKADNARLAELFADTPAELDEVLGETFCAYVEWSEFDSWGIESVNALLPIKASGILLSVDELYDEMGMPIDVESDDPYDFFMPTLQAQLAKHNLQLLEICTRDEAAFFAEENTRLVCVSTADGCVEALNTLLSDLGLALM